MLKRSVFVASLFAVLTAGCDFGGEYDKKLKATLQTAGQQAVFDLNLQPTFVEVLDAAKQNAGVKLRLPKVFDANSKALPVDNQKGPVRLPGLSYALERQLDDDSGKFFPAFLFFAVVPKTEQKADAVQNGVVQLLKALTPSASWEDASLATPTGQQITLKRLRADAEQPLLAAQAKAPEKVRTRFEIFLIDAGANSVLIGWLTPRAQAQKYNLDAAIDAAMGTVENTAPPSAPGGKAAPAGKAAAGCF